MREVGIRSWAALELPFDEDSFLARFGGGRRMGPYVEVAMLAADRALSGRAAPPEAGVWLGTGLANLPTLVPLVEAVHHPRTPRCSPIAFARSVANAASFHVAQAAGAIGPNLVVSQEELSFEAALLDAWLALGSGEVPLALVGGLDLVVEDGFHRERLGAEAGSGAASSTAAFLVLDAEPSGCDWVLEGVGVGRFDPLDGIPAGTAVARGWRAGGVPGEGPVEARLSPTASAARVCELLDGAHGRWAHVQRDRQGTWARVAARRAGRWA